MYRVLNGFMPELKTLSEEELKKGGFPKDSFVKDFKDNGFITAKSADYPELSPVYPDSRMAA